MENTRKENNLEKDINAMPKKNFLSMQLDLSQFELATEEEKHQQDRMRESTSFFRDGMRRLRKNAVSMVCLAIVVVFVLIAFIVPLFYPYDYSTSSASNGSYSSNYLAPMDYSTKETIIRFDEPTVFLGWSYPNMSNVLEGYKGLKVIDSEEYLEEVKDLLVTAPFAMENSNIELYAVWGVDRNGDGVADYGANLIGAMEDIDPDSLMAKRFTVTYDLNGGSGKAPVDENLYVAGDTVSPIKPDKSTYPDGYIFTGWTADPDVPALTSENYKEYEDAVIKGKTQFEDETTLYAVWAQDSDHNGKADGFQIKFSYGKPSVTRYRVNYNLNMGLGTKPVDSNTYAPGDLVLPVSGAGLEKETKNIFPHILGTDEIGRDYATRVIVGMRISLLVGIIAAVIVVIIGVLYGAISGYFGGKVDLIMMRIVDIIYSLPDTLIIILLSVSLKDVIMNSSFNAVASKLGGVGLVSILIVFAMLYWVGMARLVRGQVLSLREQEFVLAAKTMGVSPLKVITKHMLPNCISVIFISAALQIPSAIFTESFLSFLGVGVSIPMPSLGSLASDYRGQMTIPGREYLFVIPAIIIFLIVLSLNLLGQGLRDAFDPKLREVSK